MNRPIGLGWRILGALAGIGMACAMVALYMRLLNVWDNGWNLVFLGFVIAGGVLVEIPMVLVPSRVYARLPWWATIIGGVLLGPVALALVFFMIFALQGQLRTFSLAHLGLGWVYCVIASTSAVCVYVALIKRWAGKRQGRID